MVNIENKNTNLLLIKKVKGRHYISQQHNYDLGSCELNNEDNNKYIDEIVEVINNMLDEKITNIYFNIQSDEIIIRNINNIKFRREKEIIQLIKYEISGYMPLDLQNYVIKYKEILNNKGKGSIQGILFPKKYVEVCKSISEKLKIKKKHLYINFDILQKLMDSREVDLSDFRDQRVTIIENRKNDMIINIVIQEKIIESYVIDKFNNYSLSNKPLIDENTYYFGIKDEFIKDLQIKKLEVEDKLLLNDNEDLIDKTLDYLSVWGMIR